MTMTQQPTAGLATLVDVTGTTPAGPRTWAPLKISRAEIDAEIDRLSALPQPSNGRRVSQIVHPESTAPGLGLAPGVAVAIEVLLPGERTTPIRENAGLVQIGIHGSGRAHIANAEIAMAHLDVCNVPSMKGYWFVNDTDKPWVRLSYSNGPLLDKLGVHFVEELGADWKPSPAVKPSGNDKYTRQTAPDHLVSDTGARLRGYEYLVDIEVVDNQPLHWPWKTVSEHLSYTADDGKRSIMALYNPSTERRNGATHSFFVTATHFPALPKAKPEGRGHRHTSVAINYHFEGRGYSIVEGQRIDWEAGDLLLSAPAWSEHAHYNLENTAFGIYTIQDHPQQIGLESLVWQEDVAEPVLALGSEPGQTGYVGPRQAGD